MGELIKGMLEIRNDARARRVCALCQSTKMADEDFVDDLSRREREITQTCQACQNVLFAPDEE